jgi:helicase MOV-10
VVMSSKAESMGLGISLMERMMTKPRYQADSSGFDPKYITQLRDNYRSHPAILQFSNIQFYENQLRAKVKDEIKTFAENWSLLPNKSFPILFHCVKTPSKTAERGSSSFNEGEIAKVQFYVQNLLRNGIGGKKVTEKDIGVVTPYAEQLRKLQTVLNKDIEVGTAEYFQGREKKIIIVSTVKSCTSVGFLKNEKRLNVVLTRAQSLMIVVGNAETLQQDSLWRAFVHYCHNNNACVGDPVVLKNLKKDESSACNANVVQEDEKKLKSISEDVQKLHEWIKPKNSLTQEDISKVADTLND